MKGNSKWLKIGFGLMIILNIILLIRILSPQGKHEGPRNEVIERLKFTDEQIVAYDVLIKNHREEVKRLSNAIQVAKHNSINRLKESNIQPSLEEIGQLHLKMEELHWNHFMEIKELCNDSQKQSFDQLVEDLARMFAPKRP